MMPTSELPAMPHSRWLALLLGFFSVVGQVLLMREMMAAFHGNEAACAVILASWMFWVALGSGLLSGAAMELQAWSRRLASVMVLWGVVFPLTILAARHVREFLGVAAGEMVGIWPMAWAAWVLCAPCGFGVGAFFALLCRQPRAENGGEDKDVPSLVYLWESWGWAAGGILFVLVVRIWGAFQIAFLSGIMLAGSAIFIFHRRGWRAGLALGVMFAAGVVLINSPMVQRAQLISAGKSWPGLTVTALRDSAYGNIMLTEREGEYTLYENGALSYSTREDSSAEESVHFPLLEHPDPRRVLLVGGGTGGGLREVLKYPGVEVDYVELDPEVIALSRQFLPEEFRQPLNDPRVGLHLTDGRLFVKTAREKYDVVIVHLGDPHTALLNRYYSLEFFREVQRVLNPGGIFSFKVSSSENYLSPPRKTFLRCLHSTLRAVFPQVAAVPGENLVFLASDQHATLTLDPAVLHGRMEARGIRNRFVSEYYLSARLSPDRRLMTDTVLRDQGQINTDQRPVGYLFGLVLWSTHTQKWFKELVDALPGLRPWQILLLPLAMVAAAGLARRRSTALAVGIAATGFSGMVVQVVLIFAFQILYGHVYDKIAMITAAFMAGLALGGHYARRKIRASGDLFRIYLRAQLGLSLYPLILTAALVSLGRLAQGGIEFLTAVFIPLPLAAGFLIGIQYPLAVRLCSSDGPTARHAGVLYAVDVMAAAVGALVTAVVLIPWAGMTWVAGFCAALNGAALFILARSR